MSDDFYLGLKRLSKRYGKPMIKVGEYVLQSSDLGELDELFGYISPTSKRVKRD